ncbi:MAG: ATP-dependent zinc metalloprotease FtsH [Elusimicrobiales bacterium]|nr:ATP-dependent zinc metalloprotease FtsH [Elusimicrobiales bacterium]
MAAKKGFRQIIFWIVAFILFIAIYNNIKSSDKEKDIPYSEFKQAVYAKQVTKVKIGTDLIQGELTEADGKNQRFATIPVSDSELIKDLEKAGVKEYSAAPDRSWIGSVLLNIGWIFLFVAIWYFIFVRQVRGGGKDAMDFGKSRAQVQDLKKNKVRFKDVAGCDETKEELKDLVDYLKNPKKYQQLGGILPKGVLLYGPPGTGKTLLAKAVAGEAGVPFFTSSGSEFVEMFVGVGASRVRDLFNKAKKNAPAIVFIDELDAVGRSRFAGIGGGHDEREQTLNQILVELDGFESKQGIILIGATNRPDVLDAALLRPGRFDRRIGVPVPDVKGRLDVLKVHAKKIKLSPDADLGIVAKNTPGCAGADLANIINEAAILAAKKNKKAVEQDDLDESIEKMMAGPQRKSRVMSEKTKKVIAYHEGGHALIAKLIPGCDPVHKITIVSRGDALGYTMQMPEEDKYLVSKNDLLNTLCVMLGGRAAEEIIFGEITTGAQNDISRVSAYAHKMVLEYGMSDKVGPMSLQKEQGEVFLGKDIVTKPGYSEATAQIVDEEIKSIVHSCYERAKKLLADNIELLDKLADRLIARETVSGEELDDMMKGLDPDEEMAKRKAEADARRKAAKEAAEAKKKAAEKAKAEKEAAKAAAEKAAGEKSAAEETTQDSSVAKEPDLSAIPAENTSAAEKSAENAENKENKDTNDNK